MSRIVTFDVEIALPVEENPDGWNGARRGECGIASVVLFDTHTGRYHLADANGVDGVCDQLESADLVVSFNGLNFDVPCLSGFARRYLHLPHHYDILDHVWDAIGRREKGYGLNAICQRTLGLEKSGNGEHAPKLLKDGRWGELFDYNLNDVFLTRTLFNHILKHGYITDIDGAELEMWAPPDFGEA